MGRENEPNLHEMAQIYGVIYYQFGKRAAEELLKREKEISLKRYSSGIVREVILPEGTILYHNPSTGLFTLSWKGALLLFPLTQSDRKRIFAKRDIFIKYTKKVLLAPAVIRSTEDIRAGDEIFIVDEEGALLALGKALASAIEINSMKRGKVALVRRSSDELQEN
ncbi:MAG: PUA domain-containing protein [Fervidicoccaceae archaeon]